ncbi:Uncharacterized protein LACOL_0640 [Paucilactobacillus oligofermentans DSM 15707 = LMG 22743]|nr:Uncharacterized protein LACOL_0640 [Paucilactobacillus oligofermentans DSM 15707 = LMG 22743]
MKKHKNKIIALASVVITAVVATTVYINYENR